MKTVNQILGYQCGGEQSVTLALTGNVQDLPAKCIGIAPKESGAIIAELYRKPIGGTQEVTNFATTLGIASVDFSSVKPDVKWVEGVFKHDTAPYNWSQIKGTAGGYVDLVIE